MDKDGFSIAEVLARARENDETAARALVDYLYPLVIKIVRAHLPRTVAEEELAQDIFIKMFANLNQYNNTAPLEHWVSRIAVNHCLNAIRAQSSNKEWRMADLSGEQVAAIETAAHSTQEEPSPSQAIAAKELVDMLLASLHPEDRIVIRMLEMEERTVEEVKQITGWSATMIRVRAFRARRQLNKRFRKLRNEGNL